MAAPESKVVENGDKTLPVAATPSIAPCASDTMEVEIGEAHRPSTETIAAAEALKAEGNKLLSGE